jgi:hypothetical protein
MIKMLFLTISIVSSFPSKCYVVSNPPEILENALMSDLYTKTSILEIATVTSTPTSSILEIPTVTSSLLEIPTYTSIFTSASISTSSILEIPKPIVTSTSSILEIPKPIVTSTSSILEILTPTLSVPVPTSTPTPTPSTFTNFDNIKLILDLHNTERELKNVTNKVMWSNNLESTANDLSKILASKGCPLQHSLGKGVFAQNLYGAYGTITPNFKNAINAWISEKKLLNKPGVSFSEIGHYLIMVSSKYNNVGCSAAINFEKRCYVVTCDYS